MPRQTKCSRCAGKGLAFYGPRNLVAWLESVHGAAVRRTIEERWSSPLVSRVFDGSIEAQSVISEVLERCEKVTRCFVTAEPGENGTVWLRVYGPKWLRAEILTLPLVPTTPEWQRSLERLIEVELPKAFQPYWYPANVRASATLEPHHWDFTAWSEWEKRRLFEKDFINGLNRLSNEAQKR